MELSKRTFFDTLPEDVQNHLAKILLWNADPAILQLDSRMQEPNLQPLLAYAKGGKTQGQAVMIALENKIFPIFWNTQTLNDWVSTCGPFIFEINLLHSGSVNFGAGFLCLPNLRRATILGLPNHLSAVRGCTMLEELTIKIHTISTWDDIVATVSSLPLKTLRLDVELVYSKERLSNLPTNRLMRLCKACPGVSQLELIGHPVLTLKVWNMIYGFRALKKIGLKAKIGKQQLYFLRRLSEVDLYEPISISTGAVIGKSLMGITQKTPATADSLAKLRACPQLRRLCVTLDTNAESELVGLIDNVEDLCLAWRFRYSGGYGFDGETEYGNSLYPDYYEPNSTVLENIVGRAKQLKSFKLEKAIVRGDTVRKTLEKAGRSLENLEIHFDWQKESAVDRLEVILKSIAKYCRKLRTFHLLDDSRFRDLTCLRATREQKQSCLKALNEILVAVPKFNSYRTLKAFILNRFVDTTPDRMECDYSLDS